ncbi:MAG: O-antigen ligase family protein, partial [Chloroflexota bacterium]|nr:O-antigen ligase family protein [Chloroflexota bacterium]
MRIQPQKTSGARRSDPARSIFPGSLISDGYPSGIVWILVTLLAIATLGDWEIAGLAMAVLGGIGVGLAAVLDASQPGEARSDGLSRRPQQNWRTRLARWLVANELWILLLASPFFLFPRRAFTPLLLLFPILWVLRWRVRGRLTRRTPLDWPILFLLVMLPISLVVSADVDRSMPKFFGLLWNVGVYYAIVNYVRSERQAGWIAAGLAAAFVGVALVGLLGTEWITSGKFVPDQVYARLPRLLTDIPGTVGGLIHPNEVGGTLAFGVPFLVVLLVARGAPRVASQRDFQSAAASRLTRLVGFLAGWGIAIPLAFVSGVLVLTQSRSALFGVALAIAAFVAIRWRRTRWVFVGLAVVGLLLAVTHDLNTVASVLVGGGSGGAVGELDFAGRAEVWSRALYAMQDFPFTGVGLNMFDPVVKVLYPLFLVSPDAQLTHAHDIYLQVAMDLGVPGLVAYLGLLTAFGYICWD